MSELFYPRVIFSQNRSAEGGIETSLASVRKRLVFVLTVTGFLGLALLGLTLFGLPLLDSGLARHAKADTAASFSLQSAIQQAKPGDTVLIPTGTYAGPFVLSKPIRLQGTGNVQLTGDEALMDKPILSVQTDGAQIDNLSLLDRRSGPEPVALLVRGNNNHLSAIRIAANGIGLKLDNSRRNRIEGMQIAGAQTRFSRTIGFEDRGNGIELWDSHDNTIENSSIAGVQDGVYLENSNSTRLSGNRVSDSRYAFHLMYAAGTSLQNNESDRNVTGAMIMETDNTLVENNRFLKSSAHVHSQGILLFEAKHTRITGNLLQGNRVGLYVEQSSDNEITNNQISHNYVGVQLIDASRNVLHANDILSNVVQAQANASADNRIYGNYWDDHAGIDLTGNGQSSLPYRADPFFLTLSESYPPFQLFFQSPGMQVVEALFQTNTANWMTDESPLLHPLQPLAADRHAGPSGLLLFSSILFLLGAIPFFLHFHPIKKE